jgi:hypothetical protein
LFKFPNKSFVDVAGVPPNRLLVGAGSGLPKRLFVGSAGLLRFENKELEGVAEFCSPKRFDFAGIWLEVPKRLLVVEGCWVWPPNSVLVDEAGLDSCWPPNRLLEGLAGVFKWAKRLVDGADCWVVDPDPKEVVDDVGCDG